MAQELRVGVIGCGNISTTYFSLAPLFRGMKISACADVNMAQAKTQAEKFGLRALSVDDLLADKDIDAVVNLTIPAAHFSVTKAILEAGKHAYCEKPLVLTIEQGLELKRIADAKGLKAGCAPDTFLGGAHQAARKAIDDGVIGKITSGTAHVMNFGMEHWHPNPDFFYQPGGGPILDLGPYYVANLIHLIGPIKRVGALTATPQYQRLITNGPRSGETVPVHTPTSAHALLEFHSGAVVTLSSSWDVFAHRHGNMELYGSKGSLYVPDPNFFGGPVLVTSRDSTPEALPDWNHAFGIPNEEHHEGKMANYRTAGLADMAIGIMEGRDYRCSLERALHGVDIMTSILKSGESGQFITLQTNCTQPAYLGPEEAKALLR
jgi:predicted dehydrogenase